MHMLLLLFYPGPVSGAHLNPAVTLGFAAGGRVPLWKIPHYILGQVVGAFVGASIIYGIYFPVIAAFELENGIIRGEPGSYLSSAMFNCTLNRDITPVHVSIVANC